VGTAQASFVVTHAALDQLSGQVFPGGGPTNQSKAYAKMCEYLGLQPWANFYGWVGEQDHHRFTNIAVGVNTDHLIPIPGEVRLLEYPLGRGRSTLRRPSSYSVTQRHIEEFAVRFTGQPNGSWVSIGGSDPPGILPASGFWPSILRRLKEAAEDGTRFMVDTRDLRELLSAGIIPNLIKPNLEEFAKLIGCREEDIDTNDDEGLLQQARLLPTYALISLGAEGVLGHLPGLDCRVRQDLPPGVEFLHTDACGDTLGGGYLANDVYGNDQLTSLLNAVAAASLNTSTLTPADFPLDLMDLQLKHVYHDILWQEKAS
jgi:fructose-1-phosphate kinase PfkB-like protein